MCLRSTLSTLRFWLPGFFPLAALFGLPGDFLPFPDLSPSFLESSLDSKSFWDISCLVLSSWSLPFLIASFLRSIYDTFSSSAL